MASISASRYEHLCSFVTIQIEKKIINGRILKFVKHGSLDSNGYLLYSDKRACQIVRIVCSEMGTVANPHGLAIM